jgi:hypothetical protein
MTTTPHRPNADHTMHDDDIDNLDDKSDSTPTGFTATKIEHEMVTKVIKFSFTTPNEQADKASTSSSHPHTLVARCSGRFRRRHHHLEQQR